jgi:hypothetical protein
LASHRILYEVFGSFEKFGHNQPEEVKTSEDKNMLWFVINHTITGKL